MYLDVVSGERLPNGDVSQFMTMMNKELSSVKEKGLSEGLTIKDKAHFLAVAKSLTDAIEYYTKLWGSELVKEMDTNSQPPIFEFLDLGVAVAIKNGGNNSEISSAIFDELSLDEIKAVAKVTEKGLKEIGKEDLIKKHKIITGQRANSVMYKSLV